MDEFSYLSVLTSIIVGLAITQILKGYRGIVLSRARVRIYWPTLVWSGSLLLMNIQSWWAMFVLREVRVWTFAAFTVVLVQTILQYMLAAIVLPDFSGSEPVDLREHYWGHTRWFFGLAILVLLTSLAKDPVIEGHAIELPDLLFHIGFIAVAACALFTRHDGFHKFLAVGTALLFCLYIVVLFARLDRSDAMTAPQSSGKAPNKCPVAAASAARSHLYNRENSLPAAVFAPPDARWVMSGTVSSTVLFGLFPASDGR